MQCIQQIEKKKRSNRNETKRTVLTFDHYVLVVRFRPRQLAHFSPRDMVAVAPTAFWVQLDGISVYSGWVSNPADGRTISSDRNMNICEWRQPILISVMIFVLFFVSFFGRFTSAQWPRHTQYLWHTSYTITFGRGTEKCQSHSNDRGCSFKT